MPVTTPQARWRPLPLFITHMLAGLLLLSWLWPTSRPLWETSNTPSGADGRQHSEAFSANGPR